MTYHNYAGYRSDKTPYEVIVHSQPAPMKETKSTFIHRLLQSNENESNTFGAKTVTLAPEKKYDSRYLFVAPQNCLW